MSQKYGWTKKSYDGNIFWFKGYILDATVDSVIKSASLCLSRLGKNRDSLSSFISSIRGHFSFIIYNGNALIAVVDKMILFGPGVNAVTFAKIKMGNM